MIAYTCTLERFLRDTKDHRMTILSEDGVNRHIRFSLPQSSTYRFDLHTWPGYLCITGDCGSYVFSRTHDMFYFFGGRDEWMHDINPDYWGEKLQAIDKQGGFEQFSGDQFRAIIKERFSDFIEGDEDSEANMALRETLEDNDWGGGVEDMTGAYQFIERMNDEAYPEPYPRFHIDELWDYGLKEFTFRFIWCCRAIRWGIRQYDLGGDRFARQEKHDALVLKGDL